MTRYALALLCLLALASCGHDPYETGGPCSQPQDCTGGVCLTELAEENANPPSLDFPGGYCSSECQEDNDCQVDEICLGYTGTSPDRYCFKLCRENSQCREPEYTCVQLVEWASVQACLPEALRRPWDD